MDMHRDSLYNFPDGVDRGVDKLKEESWEQRTAIMEAEDNIDFHNMVKD